MKESFGILPSGEETFLYTISSGNVTAKISDYGAHLVNLLIPDSKGTIADVVLGFDDCNGYRNGNGGYLGATVGRNANRIKDATIRIGEKTYQLAANDNCNNLHSGPDCYHLRMWKVLSHTRTGICLALSSPDGDQGYPGNADIKVTYQLDAMGGLHIIYDGVCDQDTLFNMTNHSYFNLAGHSATDKCMSQTLCLPARWFNPDDALSIPTGEKRSVEGTPMDFRTAKPIGQDLDADYEPLHLQGGYDHNWEVHTNPCAILKDPESGRTMEVYTDCCGIQFYSGNFLDEAGGKGGIYYGKHSGIALETQYAPDSLNHPDWPQPITKAGSNYHSETVYHFSW